MRITVTGATGQLGRHVVDALLDRGVPAGDVVAAVRTPDRAADLAARGVEVREADYDRPDTLASALAGTDRLLLISASEPGKRAPQHRAVIDAARAAGVGQIVYTSLLKADVATYALADEHRETERYLADSGIPHVVLRNGWYTENYTGALAPTLEHGALLGAAGDGRVAVASRRDYAEAAAAVLTGDGHEGAVYELGGDRPVTLAELAATIADVAGRPVAYRDLPEAEYVAVLEGAGLPAPVAAILAGADGGIARGELTTDSGDLRRLIGRPTTPPADTIRGALEAVAA
ncbi:MAG: SDR family oxidoreductase [Solirubrobacteraceae bacterium]|nr:SDR family oxidoreductase [Solirubrobacteraceae bacterium]